MAACTTSTVSGTYRPQPGGLEDETVLKPRGSSLEHTPVREPSPGLRKGVAVRVLEWLCECL